MRAFNPRTRDGMRNLAAVFSLLGGLACLAVVGVYGYGWLVAGRDSAQKTVGQAEIEEQFGRAAPLNAGGSVMPSLVSAYPARYTNPKYWDDAQALGAEPFGLSGIPDGFVALGDQDRGEFLAGLGVTDDPQPTGLRIPDIALETPVYGLSIVQVNGMPQWENPDQEVGFLPASGTPGMDMNGWYFGHLSSLDEGNVFRHLPRVPELVREDPVDIYITTEEAEFLYRVSATHELHRDDLQGDLFGPSLDPNAEFGSQGSIFLCTCWPPNNYTRRIVVEAALLAVRPASAA